MKSPTINVRLAVELIERLDARAAEQGKDRTAVVRAALEAYLDAPTLTVEQRLRAVERAVVELQGR
jgi:hypothetical protein